MSAALRTAWTMLSVPVLLAFAGAYGLLWLAPPGPKPLQVLTSLSFIVALALLALRIAKVIEGRVWRLLPDGYRTIIRALGLIVLVITLLPGAGDDRTSARALAGVPLGSQLANIVFFTQLCLLLLTGIGRRLPRLVIFAYLLASVVSLGFMIRVAPNEPAFWFAAGGLCAAAWLYASFGRLPDLSTGAAWWRLHGLAAIPKLAFKRIRMPFMPDSPAHELLRSRRGARSSVPFAALIVVVWAGFQHLVVGGRRGDDVSFAYLSVLWLMVFFVALLSQDVGAAARTLWLRWGDSRAKLFGLAERMLFRDAAILCGTTWGTVTLLAWLRGLPIDAPGALKMLAAHAGAAVAPIYLALAFSTFNAWWQRVICAALCAGAVALLSMQWLFALGASRDAIGPIDIEQLLAFLLALLVLRTLASWRWRTIDWAYFRQTRKKR